MDAAAMFKERKCAEIPVCKEVAIEEVYAMAKETMLVTIESHQEGSKENTFTVSFFEDRELFYFGVTTGILSLQARTMLTNRPF